MRGTPPGPPSGGEHERALRHCERSAAIQGERHSSGLLRRRRMPSPRNDDGSPVAPRQFKRTPGQRSNVRGRMAARLTAACR
ncbi:MAG: hypothetical protein LBT00_06745 [Spirochaetaceae bacterium]|nr:hypothetical protein [Spirochaetaceae bacterium]